MEIAQVHIIIFGDSEDKSSPDYWENYKCYTCGATYQKHNYQGLPNPHKSAKPTSYNNVLDHYDLSCGKSDGETKYTVTIQD